MRIFNWSDLKKISFIYPLIIILLTSISSCKKDKEEDENVSPKTGSRSELTIDSLYLYAKEIYLWNDALPSYGSFSPREKYAHITPEINALNKELFDISQLKINENTKLPFEYLHSGAPRYSYLEPSFNQNIKAETKTSSNTKNNDITVSYSNDLVYFAISSFPKLDVLKADLDDLFTDIAKQQP
ncbi:hypothetical protein HMPREF0765_1248 [Sphingobacterium spiritivorum ATCC 33300]|uniref:Uncharacterized protein n=1 Tax=Sphingobacterium spiritivorum ATCC 33300 TaxID=525372 RepID=C2FV92_SPHSI|nr:hypothetical protein [Sphingobacterium spiritivorum]EEI93215.1 hypothetical protein HMPREF0765_1248 [Sphingobacterium spiritivorum ATCC 33300]QQS96121.1 hypothetical protein I6J03_22590 [Sphingobacterium spiritivorum]